MGDSFEYERQTGHRVTCLAVAGGVSDPDCEGCYPWKVLSVPMPEDNEAGARTVGDYLSKILVKVWSDVEFTGKRPFGSSNWKMDIEKALITAGLVRGSLDEDGYVEEVDEEVVEWLVMAAIGVLGRKGSA